MSSLSSPSITVVPLRLTLSLSLCVSLLSFSPITFFLFLSLWERVYVCVYVLIFFSLSFSFLTSFISLSFSTVSLNAFCSLFLISQKNKCLFSSYFSINPKTRNLSVSFKRQSHQWKQHTPFIISLSLPSSFLYSHLTSHFLWTKKKRETFVFGYEKLKGLLGFFFFFKTLRTSCWFWFWIFWSVMAGSNEVNLNESKVFLASYLGLVVLSPLPVYWSYWWSYVLKVWSFYDHLVDGFAWFCIFFYVGVWVLGLEFRFCCLSFWRSWIVSGAICAFLNFELFPMSLMAFWMVQWVVDVMLRIMDCVWVSFFFLFLEEILLFWKIQLWEIRVWFGAKVAIFHYVKWFPLFVSCLIFIFYCFFSSLLKISCVFHRCLRHYHNFSVLGMLRVCRMHMINLVVNT